jgi:ureidoglycolate dehydrogenase (NAD+)
MPQIHSESRTVSAERLLDFCRRLLVAAGLSADDARVVAESLVEANLRGVDSHGVARLPHYLRRIAHGSINPQPRMRTFQLGPAVARIDGDHGLGQVVMNHATGEAINLAKQAGAGWVSVCNSSHCGALAYYGLRIARAGMIGLVFTHVDSFVLPYGSRQPFCGTNPICLTAPGRGDDALCLDMATSAVPWNTIVNAALEKVSIPLGWGVDSDGHDTTDPGAVTSLYPVGTYKGSGLGLMIDVLCAILGGAPMGPDIPKMYGDLTARRLLGGLVGAIDISRFVALETFQQRVSELIRRWNALRPNEGVERVLYPGEPEAMHRERRSREGIPIGMEVLKQLQALAQSHGPECLVQ